MRRIFTLAIILSIITHGYSEDSNPKKPKKCTAYSCNDYEWNSKRGLFDPHTIQWPMHYTGDTYLDKVDGGDYDIDVVFHHYGKKTRVPLKDYRGSVYHKDPWFLDKGIKTYDALTCQEYVDDEPHWKDNTCSMVESTFENKYVDFDGPSCRKIIRQWTVVDWCKWEPNTHANTKQEKYSLVKDLTTHKTYWSYGSGHYDIEHDGWYTFDQVIKILDKDPPEMAHCEEIEFDLEGSCEAKVKIKNKVIDYGPCPGKNMTVEIKVYKTDGFVVANKWLHVENKEEFWVNLGYLGAGDYLIHWSVKDGCNNHGGCTQKLKVIDKNPPHLICIQNLSTAINDHSGATIWAADFVHKVEGPCYDNNLTYSFYPDEVVTSLTFECPDGLGVQELEVYVTSSNGVQVSCNTSLFVADHSTCDPDAMSIGGKVTDKYKNPINNAEVMVHAEEQFISSGMSNASGLYGINGISFDLGRPELAAKVYEDDEVKGLDGVDLIYLLRHIHEIEPLARPDARAAADVNSDGLIDMEDYWDLIDMIYNIPGRDARATVKTWKFYDEKVGLFDGYNHTRLVRPVKLARYRNQYSLIGLKTGDIDFSWRPGDIAGGRSAGHKSSYDIQETEVQRSFDIQVPNLADIKSLEIQAEGLTYDHIVSVNLGGEDVPYVIQEREGDSYLVVLSSADMSGMTLQVVTSADISITDQGTLYESVDESVTLSNKWILEEAEYLNALAVSPNPFDESLQLSIDVPEAGSGMVEIFTVQGQLVSRQNISLNAGHNVQTLATTAVTPGVYMIVVRTEENMFTRRIVKN